MNRTEPARTFDPTAWDAHYDDAGGGESILFRRSHERALEAVLEVAARADVWLDAGCGTGRLAEAAARRGLRVLALDLDNAMLGAARRRFDAARGDLAHAPLPGRARAEALPLATGSVNGVVAASLFGCLAEPERTLREFARVLRPGGHAVLTFTNRSSLLLRFNYRLPRAWRTSAPGGTTSGTFALYDADEVTRQLHQCGLEPITVRCYNHLIHLGRWLMPPPGASAALDRLASGRRRSRWARNFLIVARRVATT